jgi:polyisoprenoid-binding protein YceI
MNKLKFFSLLFLASTITVSAQKKYEINTEKSVVKWTGNKIGGSHNGLIKIKSGYFEVKKDFITSGSVEIDMNSISNLDLKDATYNKQLISHLKSEDFFGVDKYPTATFKVNKPIKFANGKATLSGVITIKGKSENITFDIAQSGEGYSTQLKVDRSKFDVRYGSKSFFDNLGDKVIDDIFILDIQIVLKD